MLNELYQVAAALDARGIAIEEQHPSQTPMGKNDPLLVVELDRTGAPSKITIERGEIAGKLLRIRHRSNGSSFPGFNLPTPLRTLQSDDDRKELQQFCDLPRNKGIIGSNITAQVSKLYVRSLPGVFTDEQTQKFKRSINELVGWLLDDFAGSAPELRNFVLLLETVVWAKLELASFAGLLAEKLASADGNFTAEQRLLFAEWLFTAVKLPIYLQCENDDKDHCRVVDMRMGKLLNRHLVAINAKPFDSKFRNGRVATSGRDAYTGQICEIHESFPDPKVALLGNVLLFSNNTKEAHCFPRYGLGGSETFKVSKATAQRMAGALLQLASDDRLNKTCRAIPGNRRGQQDLLIAYLEDEPDAPDPYVDLFGSEAASFNVPDFAASVAPVLKALEGKVAANPNHLIRLLAIASLDTANNQISLNRSFTVREVMEAATAWQAGAANCSPVTMPFFDKQTREHILKAHAVPSPLETASILNKIWASSTEGGFKSNFQRIISVSDAYDIFVPSPPLQEVKTRFALQTLLARMRDVFAAAGRLKMISDFKARNKVLNEPARWQVLKAVALTGIFLNQLGERHELFMKEPTYQLGRLLAYADSLHQQYCKHVRGGETPTQLIGNALFSTALEQPVFALARLAERLSPYQAWAKTFKNTKQDVKSGYEKTLLKLIGECSSTFIEEHNGAFVIRVDELPARMNDVEKAKLLLGYLADHPKPRGELPL